MYARQKRFADAEPLLKRAAHTSPGDFNASYVWGSALSQLGRTDDALRAWREALKLQPRNPRLLVQIGRAYSRDRQVNKARSAFRRALQLDSSPLTLNAAAYYSADAGLDLKNAEALSRRSLTALDAQLNAVKLEDFNRGTLELLAFAAAFWDTFGWIKFKQGDLPSAEKYLTAASDLSDESTIHLHMGRVEEALGHKKEAMRFYVSALTAAQIASAEIAANKKSAPTPQRPLSPVEQEARDRLVALAGSEQAVNEEIEEASRNRRSNRTVAVPNHDNSGLSERFVAIVTPGPKIASSATLPGTKGPSKLLARFDSKTPPQTFPDPAVTSIPRIAAIRCHTRPAQCELEFLPNETAFHAFRDDHPSQ